MADQSTAHWLEVTIYVDGESAEAVAELFSRYSENGVVCEQAVDYDESEEDATPVGPVKVSGYIEVNDEIDTVRQKIDEGLYYIGRIVELPPAQFHWVEDQNWMAVFRNYYRPIEVGENLLILPAWAEYDGDRMPVRIDPSMAFGTGTHPTTQLSMAMLEKYITPGVKLIDIGCGSGVLSITALKLGAGKAIAVDVDPESVTATHDNGERNGVLEKIEYGKGSLQEVLAGEYSYTQAPIVIANILAPILLRLFDAGIADLVEPGGLLLLSGVMDIQRDKMVERAQATGLTLVEETTEKDWVAFVFRK
ncbi:MAG: 50S ribosomal protein L11 methyltransferase [Anaerolineae bacterium]|jgi:ribosomal protein L11 methyltransferase|nr:50S ribosomal protein L11 methyltransferase [Anaerolineae bacterium]